VSHHDNHALDDDPVAEPGLKALLTQLAHDTRLFARAEIAWIKAEAGSRANIAIPGLAMVAAGISLAFAALIAAIICIVLVLAPILGTGWSAVITLTGTMLVALGSAKLGLARLTRAFSADKHR
jgi:Putative Actinobacterial Holin-X, holin superfamily III